MLGPQEGPQTSFHASDADVVIYGGAAGGGKSWALLLECLRYMDVPGFGAVVFRRTRPQITNEGSLWDTSAKIYAQLGATPNLTELSWRFGESNTVTFAQLEHEKSKYAWDGSQIALLCFDELQHFTKGQFLYMLSRNRSNCGVQPYVRCSCNPEPDSWILELIDPYWIDKDGDPIRERSGDIRYFVTVDEKFETADTPEELEQRFPELTAKSRPKSYTFIHADIQDNKVLMENDPGYYANIMALPEHERRRLLGNWKFRRSGKFIKREWFRRCTVEEVPSLWLCATGIDPSGGEDAKSNDAQGIVTAGMDHSGVIYVQAATKTHSAPLAWASMGVRQYKDFRAGVLLGETNFGGAMVGSNIKTVDPNVVFETVTASRGKTIRAEPVAAMYEKGMIVHVGWMDDLENELTGFDPKEQKSGGKSPNMLDALTMVVNYMLEKSGMGIFEFYKKAALALPQKDREAMERNMAQMRKLLDDIKAKRRAVNART